MTTPFLPLRRRRVPAALHPLVRAACSGALLGLMSTACVISVHDHHDDSGHDPEACIEDFEDCMDDAEQPDEFEACEIVLEVCLDQLEGDDEAEDGGDSPADADDGDADDGDADEGDADDDGDDDEPPHMDEGDDEPPRADMGEPEPDPCDTPDCGCPQAT